MELFYKLLALLGGLALFLYGMRLMSDALASRSGGALGAVLAKATDRPVRGFLLGLLVTCVIQSSTAAIVLTVGLVGAGLLSFRRSVSVVLGANVGTAVTAQLLRLAELRPASGGLPALFSAQNLASAALILGATLLLFLDRRGGAVAVGFGILFTGLLHMGEAARALAAGMSRLLTAFEGSYPLGFLAGAAVTGVIQSSSAVVGILQSLAGSLGVRFCGVFPVILGVNIGDCLTTFLVCRIGAKPRQIRTVTVHVLYNIAAAVLLGLLLAAGRLTGLLGDGLWYATLGSGGVANVHGLFRLIPALLLLPLSGRLADLAARLVPDAPCDAAPDSAGEDASQARDGRAVPLPAGEKAPRQRKK